jgi:Flp pilus assembly protein TadG
MTRTDSRRHGERGAALLEAAITIPLILLISVGIFEFGRAYQTEQVLTNAAREGARLAVLEGPTDAEIRTRVNSYLSGGGLATLSDSNIQVNRLVPFNGSATVTASQITITYPFQFMVLNPVVRLVVPKSTTGSGTLPMKASALMRNE